jgi:hypothetical protein
MVSQMETGVRSIPTRERETQATGITEPSVKDHLQELMVTPQEELLESLPAQLPSERGPYAM